MENRVIHGYDMITVRRDLLLDPRLSLTAKGIAVAWTAFGDQDRSPAELAMALGSSEAEVLDGVSELISCGYASCENDVCTLITEPPITKF